MKYATKYIEVEAEVVTVQNPDDSYSIVFADGAHVTLPKEIFSVLFKPAQSEGEQEFQSSLGAGRISGKKAKSAK